MGPLLFTPVSQVVGYILGILSTLFLVYGFRTIARQCSILKAAELGIQVSGPFKKDIKWANLEIMELRYYSTYRDRARGWMQLRLKCNKYALSADSTLSEFPILVDHAINQARAQGLELTESTLANFDALSSGAGRKQIKREGD